MVSRTPWSRRSQVLREDLVLFAIKTCRSVTVSYLVPKSVLAQTPIPGMDRSERPRLLWFYVKARPHI